MANKQLFSTKSGRGPATDTVNRAGGRAYKKSDKAALASYALVGTFGNTFYSSARFHLDTVNKLLNGADDRFVAQVAIYARHAGYMKDMPSYLVAWLAANNSPFFEVAFESVIDNGKMLRNFVQYIRSGVLGRKSFGSRIKRSLQNWFVARDTYGLMRAVPGNDPALADIVKMIHPKGDKEHMAFYAWLLGKSVSKRANGQFVKTRDGWRKLPDLVSDFESFKSSLNAGSRARRTTPNVPFQLLTGLSLDDNHWKGIAKDGRWMFTRMNLNTFLRHGVFKDKTLTKLIVDRLRNKEEVRKARQFPFQMLAAYLYVDAGVPAPVKNAIQDAMDHSLTNVPVIEGDTVVFVDISGSMESPVAGRGTAKPSKITCVQAAACLGAALLRVNPNNTKVIGVNDNVQDNELNPRDSVMTNATILGRQGWGGTGLGAGMDWLEKTGQTPDNVIYISDTESWKDARGQPTDWSWHRRGIPKASTVQAGFERLRRRNKKAKLINIDIQASTSSQAATGANVLNIAGFSDQVFLLIDSFIKGDLNGDHLVKRIEQSVSFE